MTTTSKQQQQRTRQEIAEAAATELASVRRQLAEHQARLLRLDSENGTLQARVAARDEDLAQRRRNVATLRERFAQESAFEAFAVNGVAQERSATLRALESYLNKEVEQLIAAEQLAATENEIDANRHAKLKAQRAECQESIESLTARIPVLQAVIDRAKREQGEEELARVLAQLKALQGDLDEKNTAVVLAGDELDTFGAEALQRLVQWPDLQAEARKQLRPHRDEVTNTLEALISYIQTLLQEGKRLPGDVPLPSTTIPRFWSLLTIPDNEIFSYDHVASGSPSLHLRLEYARRLLDHYRSEITRKG